MAAVRKPTVAAVSGVKNAGKTTFLEGLVAYLSGQGCRVAVIKHDGHEFEPDVPGTDSWKLRQAGACAAAVFSRGRWLVTAEEPDMDERRLMELFPAADFILLEGFKHSAYPKFEVVRRGHFEESVCERKTLLALVTDSTLRLEGVPAIAPEDWARAAELLLSLREKENETEAGAASDER